ncbi:MAG: hypothetical protein ACOX6T_18445 [Myxococcales bacterium]|jgi:CRISPR-associated protein Csx10
MKSLWLRIQLETDVAITESSATVGGHRCLGYVPGAALLGAAARVSYPVEDVDLAWRVFHSGAVRFGAALPVGSDGAPCVPMPLALHHPKGESATIEDKLNSNSVLNFDWVLNLDSVVSLSRTARQDGVQYKQLREGFLDGALRSIKPAIRSSMRTAVDGGSAREGFLYTISALPAGMVLLARVDADDEAGLEEVRRRLVGREVRLGRSRNAEFGRARIEESDAVPEGARRRGEPKPGEALFLCLSDLCLRNPASGQPTFEPDPADFGLPQGWRFDPARSFLRVRRYSPFNGTRKRPDLERQAIVAGSVLVFTGEGTPSKDSVAAAVTGGVGSYRAEGLGQVLFEPAILAGAVPVALSERRKAEQEAPVIEPEGELREWLRTQERRHLAVDEAWNEGMAWVEDFKKARRKLPPSQWGVVRGLARRARATGSERLVEELEKLVLAPAEPNGHRSMRQLGDRWGQDVWIDKKKTKLGEHLVDLVRKAKHPATSLEILAIHIVRAQRSQEVR